MESIEKESLRSIFDVLSKEGGMKILELANSKLISRRETPRKIGLTKRQYYTRLRELKELNLIKKEGEGYILTEFGGQVQGLNSNLGKILECKSTEASTENLFDERFKDCKKSVKLIKDYEALSKGVEKLIRDSTEEVLIATRFIDHRAVNAVLSLDEGVSFKAMVRKFHPIESLELRDSLLSFGKIKKGAKIAQNHVRVNPRLPFSFVVVDQNDSFVEIVNPLKPDNFFKGFIVKDEEISLGLRRLFMELYENSEKEWLEDDEQTFSFNAPDLLGPSSR